MLTIDSRLGEDNLVGQTGDEFTEYGSAWGLKFNLW